jgi:hypothetical protein
MGQLRLLEALACSGWARSGLWQACGRGIDCAAWALGTWRLVAGSTPACRGQADLASGGCLLAGNVVPCSASRALLSGRTLVLDDRDDAPGKSFAPSVPMMAVPMGAFFLLEGFIGEVRLLRCECMCLRLKTSAPWSS